MTLAIHGITLRRPRAALAQPWASTQRPYRHLDTSAGMLSAPPSQAARAAQGYAVDADLSPTPYATAHRSVDIAEEACAELVRVIGVVRAAAVRNLLHCQATLDQQPLVSTCLRIGLARFPAVAKMLSLGQLGTAGVPTALVLAKSHLRAGLGSTVVTAADKWLHPFDRQYGSLVTYSDAAGALLVDAAGEHSLARIDALVARVMPHRRPFWDRPAESVVAELTRAISGLLRDCMDEAGCSGADIDMLAGDRYGCAIPANVRATLGLGATVVPAEAATTAHLSSAEFMHSLLGMLRASRRLERPLRGAIWTASPNGAIAAMLVTCDARHARFHHEEEIESVTTDPGRARDPSFTEEIT